MYYGGIECKLPDRMVLVSGRIEGQTNDGIQSAIVLVVEDGGHLLLRGSSYYNVGIGFSTEWEVWSMIDCFRDEVGILDESIRWLYKLQCAF